MTKSLSVLATTVVVSLLYAGAADAQVTVNLNYQGRVEVDAVAVTTSLTMRLGVFAENADATCLADAAPQSCGLFFSEIDDVQVVAGAFSAVLRDVPVSAVAPPVELAIAIRNPDDSFTLIGRQPLSDVNSSAHAKNADNGPFAPPVGSIIAWHPAAVGQTVADLPGNWAPCNGQTVNGFQLPDLNGTGKFLRGSTTSGTLQDDALQEHTHIDSGHSHAVPRPRHFAAESTLGSTMFTSQDIQAQSYFTTSNSGTAALGGATDFGAGAPRTTTETRPTNMSVVWIMRVR